MQVQRLYLAGFRGHQTHARTLPCLLQRELQSRIQSSQLARLLYISDIYIIYNMYTYLHIIRHVICIIYILYLLYIFLPPDAFALEHFREGTGGKLKDMFLYSYSTSSSFLVLVLTSVLSH